MAISPKAALISANGLNHNQAGKPNYYYQLNPYVAEHYFGVSRTDPKLILARCGVHGDGSCAYHSICTALNIDDYNHQNEDMQKQIAYKFRCSFADKLTQDSLRELVKKSRSKSPLRLNEIQEALCDPKVWADETTIRFMAEQLNMNLIFLDMTKNNVYCGMHHEDALCDGPCTLPPTIVVLWVNHSHFEPLAEIINVGTRTAEVRMVFYPAENPDDAKLIRSLMKRYKLQCAAKKKKSS